MFASAKEIIDSSEIENSLLVDTPTSTLVEPVKLRDFMQREFPPREMLLAPWLPTQGLAMVYAPRGVGKTYLTLSIAMTVATGGELLGWKADTPRSVLYIDGEMPACVMQERLNKFGAKSVGEMSFSILNPDLCNGDMPDLADINCQKMLEPYIRDIDLIIVDNISCLCRSGVENKSEDWQTMQAWALKMRSTGHSVLFVHHANKNGGQRGTSKREDILDTVMKLERPPDYEAEQGARFQITFDKSRGFHGEEAGGIEASLCEGDDGNFIWESQELKLATFDRVVSLIQEGLTQTEVSNEMGVNKSTVSRHVRKAKAAGLLK